MKEHTKAEIRAVILDILFDVERVQYSPTSFESLASGLEEVFGRRGEYLPETRFGITQATSQRLSDIDGERLTEVFWDLFRDGIITIGLNRDNPAFSKFRLHSDFVGKQRDSVECL